MPITKIEVSFARPVELTDGEMQKIDEIVNDAARRTETPEFVHWAAGCGSKPNWSKTDCKIWGYDPTPDSPESGEPTFDDSVFCIETATRERYSTDKPWEPYVKPKTSADRFCELLDAIDERSKADGLIKETLKAATEDEWRRLYLFADRIRKEAK